MVYTLRQSNFLDGRFGMRRPPLNHRLVHHLLRTHEHHHGLHHGGHVSPAGLGHAHPRHFALWVLVRTVLPRAAKAEFTVDLRVYEEAFITVAASGKILAVFSGVEIRTVLRLVHAVGEMLTFDFLLACLSWLTLALNIDVWVTATCLLYLLPQVLVKTWFLRRASHIFRLALILEIFIESH